MALLIDETGPSTTFLTPAPRVGIHSDLSLTTKDTKSTKFCDGDLPKFFVSFVVKLRLEQGNFSERLGNRMFMAAEPQPNSNGESSSKIPWKRITLGVLVLSLCVIVLGTYQQFWLTPEERQFVGQWVGKWQHKSDPMQYDFRSNHGLIVTFQDNSVSKWNWTVSGKKMMLRPQEPTSLKGIKRQVMLALYSKPPYPLTEVLRWERTDDGFILTSERGHKLSLTTNDR